MFQDLLQKDLRHREKGLLTTCSKGWSIFVYCEVVKYSEKYSLKIEWVVKCNIFLKLKLKFCLDSKQIFARNSLDSVISSIFSIELLQVYSSSKFSHKCCLIKKKILSKSTFSFQASSGLDRLTK